MLLIKAGYVIDPRSGSEGVRDILIDKGKIVRMEAGISETFTEEKEVQVIDAEGKVNPTAPAF